MVVEVMFRSYVPNARRARGSMVKDSGRVNGGRVNGGVKPELITRVHRGCSTLHWVDQPSVNRLPWHWPHAERFDTVLGRLASHWFAFGHRMSVGFEAVRR
jgi:hypothetical protein